MSKPIGKKILNAGHSMMVMVLVMVLMAAGCGPSNDAGEFPGGEVPEVTYTLSVGVSPAGGGSVSPSSGEFVEGTEVSVEAVPNDGWVFDRWSGDINSEENPLVFQIERNTSLTANFVSTESIYTGRITLEEEDRSLELLFGQAQGATDGYDEGLDVDAPPEPPSDALNAWFEIDDLRLFHDFRSSTASSVTWELLYRTAGGGNLNVSWSIDEESLNGTLILTDEQDSFEVDMLLVNSHEFDAGDSGRLFITYELD